MHDELDTILGMRMGTAKLTLKNLLDKEPTPRILDAIEKFAFDYVSAGRENLNIEEYDRKSGLTELKIRDNQNKFFYLLFELPNTEKRQEVMETLFNNYLSLRNELYELGQEWGIQI